MVLAINVVVHMFVQAVLNHKGWKDLRGLTHVPMKVSLLMISFYFTNIPKNVQYVDLRKGLKVCSILSDFYVSRNRKALGQLCLDSCVIPMCRIWTNYVKI